MTAAEQWFERTLDDSANKRLSIPEMFLAADASLILALNVSEGLVVYPTIIEKHLREELPFIATENILMEAVKKGGDRQQLHERIRKYSMEAQKEIKTNGGANPLLKLIADDPAFRLSQADFDRVVDARRFVGRSPEQVTEFIESVIDPLLSRGKKYGMIQRHEITV
jgi:adenylosuccinate lyase